MLSFPSAAARRTALALAAAVLALAGCGDDDTTDPTPTVGVTVSPTSAPLTAGGTTTINVTVSRGGGYTGPVTLTLEGAPTGATGTFNPASVGSGSTSSALSITTLGTTAPGTYPLVVRARGTGAADATASVSLVVTAPPTPTYTFTATPAALTVTQGTSSPAIALAITRGGGFAGPVTFAVTGAPAGVTPALTGSPTSGNSASLALAVSSTTAPGTYTITVTGTAAGITDRTATIALTVAAAAAGSYTMAVTPASVPVTAGATGTATLNLTRTGGFAGAVSLATSIAGAPAGLTVTPASTSITGNTVALNVATTAATPAGTHTVTVTGTAAGVTTQTATFNVVVSAAATGAIALSVAPTPLTVQAGGATATSTVTLARTAPFTGAVGLSITGAPAGLTVTVAPTSIAEAATTAVVTVGAASTVAPNTYPITITGTGTGVTVQTTTLNVTVTAAATGSFALAAAPAAVTVQQGATGTSTINVTRTAPFTGPVTLAITGAPAALNATLSATSVTGASATLTLAPTTALATATYNLIVTGTAAGGVASQNTTVAVNVTAGGGGTGAFSYTFCDAGTTPIWFAVQDGTGPWTRVTSTNNVFRYDVGTRGGIAYVTGSGSSFQTTIVYGTAAELSALGACTTPRIGTKSVSGSVAGLASTDQATVSLASRFRFLNAATGTTFTLDSVPDGALDLIAARTSIVMSGSTFSSTLSRLIIRRGLTPASGSSTLPVLDFAGGADAFDPVQRTLTVTNAGGDEILSMLSYSTAASGAPSLTNFGSAVPLYTDFNTSSTGTRTIYGVPTARQAAGDLHQLLVFANAGTGANTSQRAVFSFYRDATDRTVALGPALGVPTITQVATSPVLRYRAQLAVQPEYDQTFNASFSQSSGGADRTVNLSQTSGHRAGAATWDVTIPDFSGVAGWLPLWGLQPGGPAPSTSISASGFVSGSTFGDGTVLRLASRNSGTTAQRMRQSFGLPLHLRRR